MKTSDIEEGIYGVLDYIEDRVNRTLSKEVKISVGDVLAAAFGISIILILLAVVFATGFFVATYINKENTKAPPPSSPTDKITPSSNAVSDISTKSFTSNQKDLTPITKAAEVKSVVPIEMAMSPSLNVKEIINSTVNLIHKPTSLHICNATEVLNGRAGIDCKYGEMSKNICYQGEGNCGKWLAYNCDQFV